MKAIGSGSVSSVLMVLLNVGWYGTALGLALAACLAIATPFIDMSGSEMDIPASFSVDARRFHVTAPTLGIQNAELEDGRGSGKLKFPAPSRAFFASTAVGFVVLLGLALWVIGLLRAVFRTLRDGHPFVAANGTRIRRIAYAVILGELGRFGAAFVGNYYTMRHFSADGLRFDVRPDLNVLAIVAGLIIFVIAEVFRIGTRLDEEQSLTV